MTPDKLIKSIRVLEEGTQGYCKVANIATAIDQRSYEIGFYYKVVGQGEELILSVQKFVFSKYEAARTMVFSKMEQLIKYLEQVRQWAENEMKKKLSQFGLSVFPHTKVKKYYKFYPKNETRTSILRTKMY